MSLIAELAAIEGVFAAGEYSYRGDRFSYKGHINEEHARMASIMCRATTMGVHMQTDIMAGMHPEAGVAPAGGWVVRGPQFTVCVMANVFCFLDNQKASLNTVMAKLRKHLADAPQDLI
jgi:roadblock/LC7 domain-containing protein